MDRSLRGSSYRSGRGRNEPRSLVARVKEGLRKTIAFLFGHVGICGLVVGYIIMGAFAFMAIEKETSHRTEEAMKRREETVQHLWRITYQLNVLYRDNWTEAVNEEVLKFQKKVVEAVGDGGYDGIRSQKMDVNSSRRAVSTSDFSNEINQGTKDNQWTFSSAFLYCLTVITTIGYGNISPKTVLGKVVTIIYAMVGMPLFLLYVSNMGDVLATSFRWIYVKLCKCQLSSPRRRRHRLSHRSQHKSDSSHHPHLYDQYEVQSRSLGDRNYSDDRMFDADELQYADERGGGGGGTDYQTVTVPITISLIVMASYMCGGAMLFGQWEEWDFLDGSYFCFISLSTTGLGDLVPGDSFNSTTGVELSLIFCSMYLIIGMALIAMCFNLMQEEVIAKIRRCGKVLGCIKSIDE